MTRTFTVREVVNAIRQNGYKQTIGAYIRSNSKSRPNHSGMGDEYYDLPKESIIGACALGQAGLNLGVNPDTLASLLPRSNAFIGGSMSGHIIKMNDEEGLTCQEIANRLEEDWLDYMDYEITFY